MHNYLKYDEQTISDFSNRNIEEMYACGFLMTRVSKGQMYQTKSIRIDLSKFELTSENRRILRKTEDLQLQISTLPMAIEDYNWRIHKIGKDFYTQKFGDNTFSANKIKELITTEQNFNLLLNYSFDSSKENLENETLEKLNKNNEGEVGYCIALETQNIMHYCYPFYRLDIQNSNLGMGMMLKAILWAKETGRKYIYLGSMSRESDKYKLQFRGVEIWEADKWKQIEI